MERQNKHNIRKRVVITGLGIAAPNGVGIAAFAEAIQNGTSGIRHYEALGALKFSCQLGGIPQVTDEMKRAYMSDLQLRNFNSSGILYGIMAGMEAMKQSGVPISESTPNYDLGIVFGTGTSGVD
ncbi:MAG: beta-ketoacyl synthase N-terminal-like domain-containing protein, partial [Marinirhabdus sp.]|nr:beta-ketoacyl synthase N-terminal-like domain-containing protein [Marinirhabdus sp.]